MEYSAILKEYLLIASILKHDELDEPEREYYENSYQELGALLDELEKGKVSFTLSAEVRNLMQEWAEITEEKLDLIIKQHNLIRLFGYSDKTLDDLASLRRGAEFTLELVKRSSGR